MTETELHIADMSRDELTTLRQQIDAMIAKRDLETRRQALDAASRAAGEYGYRIADLFDKASGSKGSKGAIKYRNPHNPTQTWTGRGRNPKWFTRAIEKGLKPEDMAV